ncbi:c6 transcription factor [Stemphylium lycopersici]|nr:c6 transcription factor [Stemphylium lycopersici]RAR02248.1 c6 transcription factor [Stemphylium lycopersici]
MSFVDHLSQVTKSWDTASVPNARVVDVLEDISYPSIEVLYWMVRDYFKHVSPKSLKEMGHALIYKTADPETLLLYSICVNSAAFKFINTVLSEDSMGEVGAGMRASAANYLNSVKLAMARIHLLSAPSLVFLQSLLCSAFIAQGVGDLTHCWTFITAACKVCEDLSLEAQVKARQTETEDDEEIYYCYTWCHILDKNYSMMQGRSRFLLEYDGLDAALSSPFNKAMSSLLSTYLRFVPIQAIYMSELHPDRIANKKSLLSRVELVVEDLLYKLDRVYAGITSLYGTSESWSGLHAGSELNTVQFSYHSLRTSILRSRQICQPAKRNMDSNCLESARMAMTTLKAIQEESVTITDVRAHVSYMHWTVLYHPLTPFFVLFCNIVASSNESDFRLLNVVTSQLDGLTGFSPSIAKLQTLFKSFIGLCEGLVVREKEITLYTADNEQHQLAVELPRGCTSAPQPSSQVSDDQTQLPVNMEGLVAEPAMMNQPGQEIPPDFPTDNSLGMLDQGWGLFDTQPTLGWLDADFSFFNSNQ